MIGRVLRQLLAIPARTLGSHPKGKKRTSPRQQPTRAGE